MTFEIPLAADGRHAVAIVTAALEYHRLLIVRSFTLRAALTADMDCGCPNRGTDACQCQYVVLLVYSPSQPVGRPPATVTVHSRSAAAWVTVVQDANALPDPALVDQIMAALAGIERPANLMAARPAER